MWHCVLAGAVPTVSNNCSVFTLETSGYTQNTQPVPHSRRSDFSADCKNLRPVGHMFMPATFTFTATNYFHSAAFLCYWSSTDTFKQDRHYTQYLQFSLLCTVTHTFQWNLLLTCTKSMINTRQYLTKCKCTTETLNRIIPSDQFMRWWKEGVRQLACKWEKRHS